MGSVRRHRGEDEYLTPGQRAARKRSKDDFIDRQEGYELFQTAPDERPLEKRWGMSFHISLADLEGRSRWVGANRDGYWLTPVGKMRTFGDLRRLLEEAYRDLA